MIVGMISIFSQVVADDSRNGFDVIAGSCPGCQTALQPSLSNKDATALAQSEIHTDGPSATNNQDGADGSSKAPFAIDAVYTWVDGTDEKWLKAKEQAQKENAEKKKSVTSFIKAEHVTADGNIASRFKSHDELKYSLRSLEKFAGEWISHIYIIVFDGQRPSYVNENSDKITFVDHKQIFPENSQPTFNSAAIEVWMDKIPGLSEHFVYLNDDFLLGLKTDWSHLFTSDGKPRMGFQKNWGEISGQEQVNTETANAHHMAVVKSAGLLNAKYGQEKRYKLRHQLHPMTRAVWSAMRDTWSNEVLQTGSQQFRDSTDIQPMFLAAYKGMYEGTVEKVEDDEAAGTSNQVISLVDDVAATENSLKDMFHNPKMFMCIEDNQNAEENSERIDALFKQYAGEFLPEKASFEK